MTASDAELRLEALQLAEKSFNGSLRSAEEIVTRARLFADFVIGVKTPAKTVAP